MKQFVHSLSENSLRDGALIRSMEMCVSKRLISSFIQSVCGKSSRRLILFFSLCLLVLAGLPIYAQDETAVSVDGKSGKLTVDAKIIKPEDVPLFYHVKAVSQLKILQDQSQFTSRVIIKKQQGEGDKYSIGLKHTPEKMTITGDNVKEWSVRIDLQGNVYLDIIPKSKKNQGIEFIINSKQEIEVGENNDLLVTCLNDYGIKDVTGIAQSITIDWHADWNAKMKVINGFKLADVGETKNYLEYIAHSSSEQHELALSIMPSDKSISPISVRSLSVSARIDDDQKSAVVDFNGSVTSTVDKEQRILIARGKALALMNAPELKDAQIKVVNNPDVSSFYLVTQKKGEYSISLKFAAKVEEYAGWKTLGFQSAQGAILPLNILNMPQGVEFNTEANVIPSAVTSAAQQPESLLTTVTNTASESQWKSYLPANGVCDLGWRMKRDEGDSALFFTTESVTDVQVGGGLISQISYIDTKVLQGEMNKYTISMAGNGDIVNVWGSQIREWKVNQNGEIEISLTGEYDAVSSIAVQSQYPLGNFPAKLTPLKLTPKGAMRHSGYIRLTNKGAVRLEVTGLEGLMQLSPEKYPRIDKHIYRQVFVYKYPSRERSWVVIADQILPEVGVRQNVVYEVGDTDRLIHADIEIDVREAALREWQVFVPDGYAVSSVTGASVKDYALSSELATSGKEKGKRGLKFFFKEAIKDRHLIKVQLERNIPAKSGDWNLPAITYPTAKTVRGQIGVAAALGWRIVPSSNSNLAEVSLAQFQKKSARVQQAYRQRQADWSAIVKVEALGQSVQADVFHLYTLKEGVVECGVFLNYFIVGAPVDEWKLQIPASAGNISVVGQSVRNWRRSDDKDEITVSLQQPALGGVSLFIKYEEPLKADGSQLQLGQVQPLGVQNESGYIQVISPMQVKHSMQDESKNLLKLTAAELPAEYRILTTVPSIAAWQYASRPFNLIMNVDWYEPSHTVSQSIDFAKVTSEISKGGQVKNLAEFFVKTRGRQALRMKLQEETELLSVHANGERVNARVDGAEIIIPLPTDNDLNTPVEVKVLYVLNSKKATDIKLALPMFSAPSVITNWKVVSKSGRYLFPKGGNVKISKPVLTETGYEWLQNRIHYVIGVVLLVGMGAVFYLKKNSKIWMTCIGAIWLVLAGLMCVKFADEAYQDRRVNVTSLDIVAPAVPANHELTLHLSALSEAQALLTTTGVILMILGSVVFLASFIIKFMKKPLFKMLGLVAFLAGTLAHHGGAILFFISIGLIAALLILLKSKAILQGIKKSGAGKPPTTAVAQVMLLLTVIGFCFSQNLNAQNQKTQNVEAEVADSVNESWVVKDQRLHSSLKVKWQAKVGDKLQVLRQPAILSSFTSSGARVIKESQNGSVLWMAVAEKDGVIDISMDYEMPISKLANIGERPWPLLSANSVMRKLTVKLNAPNMEVVSDHAVRSKEVSGLETELVLSPVAAPLIKIRPRKKDIDKQPVSFFVQSYDLYLPAPGVVDGLHLAEIKMTSGQIRDLKVKIPEGLIVGNVSGRRNVHTWTYDVDKRELHVKFSKPVRDTQYLSIATQVGLKSLPQKVLVNPLQYIGAKKSVGMIALGFGNDAQPDAVKAIGVTTANINDFNATLSNEASNMRKGYTLHSAYRFDSTTSNAGVSLRVEPVSPEVRVTTKQELQISDERVLLKIGADVSITRAGVFKVRMHIPENFEVETVTGAELSDWSEVEENGKNMLSMNLKGKTMGKHSFVIVLVSNISGATQAYEVPRADFEDAVRQIGQLVVRPEKGVRVLATERHHVSQLDARKAGLGDSGALAFRLLQADWKLTLAIDELDAWITAKALQEVTLREAQTRVRVGLAYHVRHSAVKSLKIQLPVMDDEERGTVRVSGGSVKEVVHIAEDVWEVKLRRGVIGRINFDLEYQLGSDMNVNQSGSGQETIKPIKLLGASRVDYFVSVRTFDRLETKALNQDRAWRVNDWSNIDKNLKSASDRSVPALCYRVSNTDVDLKVQVKRLEMANTLKLRVVNGEITTLFNSDGSALTHVLMNVEVAEKGAVKVDLPKGSKLFSVLVNGTSEAVVTEGEVESGSRHSFNVTAGKNEKEPSIVQLVYSHPGLNQKRDKVKLVGPSFSIPLEKIEWNVIMPDGYSLANYRGDFEHVEYRRDVDSEKQSRYNDTTLLTKETYKSEISRARTVRAEEAKKLMKEVNTYIKKGDHKKANWALNSIANDYALDQASNIDAQVQLKNVQTQNALMGLNTRRQKLYFDNKSKGNDLVGNTALEEAASRNPLLKGDTRFDSYQVEDFMQGMTDEEKKSLNDIARLLVDPQLTGVQAPQAIEVTMPQGGNVETFVRDIQIAGDSGLVLELGIKTHSESKSSQSLILLLIIAAGMYAVSTRLR